MLLSRLACTSSTPNVCSIFLLWSSTGNSSQWRILKEERDLLDSSTHGLISIILDVLHCIINNLKIPNTLVLSSYSRLVRWRLPEWPITIALSTYPSSGLTCSHVCSLEAIEMHPVVTSRLIILDGNILSQTRSLPRLRKCYTPKLAQIVVFFLSK